MPDPRRTSPAARLLLLLPLLSLAAGGCAFDRRWRDLKRQQWVRSDAAVATASTTAPAETSADPLAGRWEGKWISEATGHTGKLRAIVTPKDNSTASSTSPSTYRVDYDAMFFGILRAGYGTDLTATRRPDGVTAFEGRQNLGALAGGVYEYAGSADGATFTSTYRSSADHGRFEMTRPKE